MIIIMRRITLRILLPFLPFLIIPEVPGFVFTPNNNIQSRRWYDDAASAMRIRKSTGTSSSSTTTALLMSGTGIATNYTWKEEAFEIDVTVQVPENTRAKDIIFKATTKTIDLRLLKKRRQSEDQEEIVLLDPQRKFRGRVNVDGTYWVISDSEDNSNTKREITVTIEKIIKTPQDDFEVVDYDWKGVYSNDNDEVSYRKYDEPEELNIRDYAASLGVDIDNINMSMVDKTMFSSGLNLTQSSLDELTKSGYMKEITQQADGSEYTVNNDNNNNGEPETFNPLGVKNIGQDEFREALQKSSSSSSPWKSAVPVEHDKETNKTFVRNFTRAAFADEAASAIIKDGAEVEDKTTIKKKKKKAMIAAKAANAPPTDPIDTLTVARLKEILKSQGLKVSGTKKELQERVRQRVNSLLQGE